MKKRERKSECDGERKEARRVRGKKKVKRGRKES
jgi:hypothetical protein